MNAILSVNRLAIELGVPRSALEDVAKNKDKHYDPFTRSEKKKDGTIKERKIDNPDKAIRIIQKKINKIILRPECEKLPTCMTGSIKDRSIVSNATPHVGSEAVLSVDITDCFPSIDSHRVYQIFRNNLGCSPPVSKLLTKLTTYGDRLPQGAPTSSSLCNLVMAPLVNDLEKLAESQGIKFTQYIDDLTFSGSRVVLERNRRKVIKLVESHDFKVNARKLNLTSKFQRMEITGLVVNSFVSVGRKYIREVERDIMRGKNSTKIRGKISHIQSINLKRAKKLRKKAASR